MNFLDIVGTLIELSQKQEELSDEVKTIRLTLQSLKSLLGKIDSDKISSHLKTEFESIFSEASELIKRISTRKNSFFSNIKNMLPGGDLSMIKEKNQKLKDLMQVLNLELTVNGGMNNREPPTGPNSSKLDRLPSRTDSMNNQKPPFLRSTTHSDAVDNIYLESTLADDDEKKNLNESTLADNDDHVEQGEVAFKLLYLYDEKTKPSIKAYKAFQNVQAVCWNEGTDQLEYPLNRANYQYLPSDVIQRISRDHATIIAERKVKKSVTKTKTDNKYAATVDDGNGLFAPTVDDTKLLEATIDDSALGQEEEKGFEEGNSYILKDISLNGTYYCKGYGPVKTEDGCARVTAEFIQLKKDCEVKLEHGDIVALVARKPHHNELIFGFQFILE